MTPIWQRMRDHMQRAGLAARPQESYLGAACRLADHYQKAPDHITEDELRQYFLMLRNERKVSRSTITIALGGMKFLFERTLQRDWPTLTILRPPAEHKLPAVLSVAEVHDLLARIRIPRYRVCLSLIYACGLRLLEGVTLSVPQIDSARMVLHIQAGKGNKARYVPLPQQALTLLRAYWLTHRPPSGCFPRLTRPAPRSTRPLSQWRRMACSAPSGQLCRKLVSVSTPPCIRCATRGPPICLKRV